MHGLILHLLFVVHTMCEEDDCAFLLCFRKLSYSFRFQSSTISPIGCECAEWCSLLGLGKVEVFEFWVQKLGNCSDMEFSLPCDVRVGLQSFKT